jgi:hypothetical protein
MATLTGAKALLAVLAVLAVSAKDSESVPRKTSLGRAGCSLISSRYVPSGVELEWLGNVSVWQDTKQSYCQAVQLYKVEFDSVLKAVKVYMSGSGWSTTWGQDRLLSKFQFSYQCGSKIVRQATFIEPLAGALRNPLALCGFGGDYAGDRALLISRDYIIMDSNTSLRNAMMPGPSSTKPKAFLFDLGASTFLTGWGGASQKVMIESYQQRGIVFNHILLWEANKVDPQTLFGELPPHLYASYQVRHLWVCSQKPQPMYVHAGCFTEMQGS